MTKHELETPISVADARAGLSQTLKRFRTDSAAPPVVLGSHRKPEAVLMPYRQFLALQPAAPTNPPVRELLHRQRDLIARLARLNHLASVAVFGSVARGDYTGTSDIDLLVEPDEG